MCMDYSRRCACGRQEVSLIFRDDLMPPQVISAIYCPECSDRVPEKVPAETADSVTDNGWVIQYDMEVARFSASSRPGLDEALSPGVLFDEGYATWRGIYPGEEAESARERRELAELAKTDPRGYLQKMRVWAVQRMDRLRQEGWRKAREEGEPVGR